jgi:hypothetical protein
MSPKGVAMQNGQCKKNEASSLIFFVAHKRILSNEIIEGLRMLSDLHRHMADRGFIPATTCYHGKGTQGKGKTCMAGIQPCKEREIINKKQASFPWKTSH